MPGDFKQLSPLMKMNLQTISQEQIAFIRLFEQGAIMDGINRKLKQLIQERMDRLKQQYVNHEIATTARNRGFREAVTGIRWDDGELAIGSPELVVIMCRKDLRAMPCPTYDQIVAWLRDQHGIFITSDPVFRGGEFKGNEFNILPFGRPDFKHPALGVLRNGSYNEEINRVLHIALKLL